jgi:hypothetical protein
MPEPILVAIAAALAGKSVGNLYDLVKKKFANRRQAAAALEAAQGAAPDSPEVHTLTEHLAEAANTDPEFSAALQATWAHLSASTGGVVNQVSGTVHGNLVQARDIQGGITFS